jgi:signal peptidase I
MLLLMAIFILLNMFVFAPFLFMGISRKQFFTKTPFTYNQSLKLCVQIVIVSLLSQLIKVGIKFYLPPFFSLLNIIVSAGVFVLIIFLIKLKFNTTVTKAIFIHIICIIFAAIIAVSYKSFVCQAYKIPAGSNIPTVLIGDHILVNKPVYRFASPERGDFVIFKSPKNENTEYLKRVIALPNEQIEIRNKKIFINGQPINEEYIVNTDNEVNTRDISPRDNLGPITVSEDSYFLLGDNRDNSFDSRFFGSINIKKIKGKADIIYFSYNKETKTIRTDRIGLNIE